MSLPTFQYNPRMISILPKEERFRQILPARRTVLKHYSFFSCFYIASSKHEGTWKIREVEAFENSSSSKIKLGMKGKKSCY